MTTQKTGSIKVPQFDREHYSLWKMKMLLFIRASNPMYISILKNGPYIPMKTIEATAGAGGSRTPARSVPKEMSEYTDTDKEYVRLDTGLMLIIADSTDKEMSYQIMNCTSGKHMWDTIELLMEGTAEVKENRLDILTSQYEAFKSFPGETVSQLFERFTRLLNELSMQGKTYPLRESNRKFMLTLPHHIEHRVTSIRERDDFATMSLERLFGKLKTYEMEQEQRSIIYGTGTVESKNLALAKSAALVVHDTNTVEGKVQTSSTGKDMIIEAELDSVNLEADESDYYTIEELEQMEDQSMAYLASNFKHIRFKRNPKYKFKGTANRFQRGGKASGSSFRGGFRTNMIDKSTVRCYNCNELGHFASDCKKPRQARPFEKRESIDDLKKENQRLKQQIEAMSSKLKGRAYVAEGRSWDDTDSDEEKEHVNLALMADSSEESPQSSQVPILTTIDMTNSEYKQSVHDLSVELFNVHTSMLASEKEIARLVLKIKNLESKNEELMLGAVALEDLKQKNAYLENKVKVNDEIEAILRNQVSELELKLNAYKNSAFLAKEIIDTQTLGNKTAIGFDYTKKDGKRHVNPLETSHDVKKDVPVILKNVASPIFTKPVSEPILEETLIINQEMLVEDQEKKKNKTKPIVSGRTINFVKAEFVPGASVGKVKNNRNGKAPFDKSLSAPIVSRKLCLTCNSAGHLTHSCTKAKAVTPVTSRNNNMLEMPDFHEPCGIDGCMLCAYNVMNAYYKLMNTSMNTSSVKSTVVNKSMKNKPTKVKTENSPKARKELPVSKPVDKSVKASTEKVPVKVKVKHVESSTNVTPVKVPKPYGPNQVWVPKSV